MVIEGNDAVAHRREEVPARAVLEVADGKLFQVGDGEEGADGVRRGTVISKV
jgi:hypothetical protein